MRGLAEESSLPTIRPKTLDSYFLNSERVVLGEDLGPQAMVSCRLVHILIIH